ncbi:hypothetical protein DMK83_25635, partial [Vibrio parahaemolyticus]|nr:hypothetical protein [Vibrio parahaemolyticus]
MPFIIEKSKLQLGDVILTMGEGKSSKLIAKVTGGDFSHAMIYVGNSLVHAIPEGGVYSKNPQRLLFKNANQVKVLRYKGELSNEAINNIAFFARTFIGTVYSMKEAAYSPKYRETTKQSSSTGQYCSKLVAKCYESEGISLVHNSDYCTPEDINQSSFLKPVEGCLRIAKPEEVEYANSYDPNILNQDILYEWLYKAKQTGKDEKANIQTINDVEVFVSSNPDYDEVICSFVENTEYLNNYSADRDINLYRYDADLFYAMNLSDRAIVDEVNLNIGEYNRHHINYLAWKEKNDICPTRFSKLHIQLYKNLLLET